MTLEPDLIVEDLQPGDEVTVLFESAEDGVDQIYELTVRKPADESE